MIGREWILKKTNYLNLLSPIPLPDVSLTLQLNLRLQVFVLFCFVSIGSTTAAKSILHPTSYILHPFSGQRLYCSSIKEIMKHCMKHCMRQQLCCTVFKF